MCLGFKDGKFGSVNQEAAVMHLGHAPYLNSLGGWTGKMHLYYRTVQGTFLSQAVTGHLSLWVVRTALDIVLVR